MKLETIINSTKCYGCGACACSCNFGALKMGSNGQGFMYPILEQSKCKNCNSCYKVCPAVDDNLNKIANNQIQVEDSISLIQYITIELRKIDGDQIIILKIY